MVYLVTPAAGSFFAGKKLPSFLTDREFKFFLTLTTRERKREWLAGRLATKSYIKNYLFENFGAQQKINTIEVYYGNLGEPRWRLIDNNKLYLLPKPRLHISLSHSHGYAVATGDERAHVGVDIEFARRLSTGVERFFLAERERKMLPKLFPEKIIGSMVFWTLKEAALKALKTGLRTSLRDVLIIPNDSLENMPVKILVQSGARHVELTGIYRRYGKFIVAKVVRVKEANIMPIKVKKVQ